MLRIAIKMLFGDGARFYGILLGLAFASLLIAQQSSIFVGLMSRTSAFIRDTPQADIWVTDPDLLSVDDAKALRDTDLQRVRGVPGVAWAVPLFKGLLGVKLGDGRRTVCEVVGIDDATLIGGPHTMLDGQVADLRQADAVIVDNRRLARELRMATGERGPDGKPIYRPMRVGDEMELNERRAVVVGICDNGESFQYAPQVYTTYSRALQFQPAVRRVMSMVLVKAEPGQDPAELARQIEARTGLSALPASPFEWKTIGFWMRETGIPINFGIAIALGFFVGVAIAGQMFYNFTLENLKYFGAMKAMGASSWLLLRMVALQGVVAGAIGLGLGLGLASAFGLSNNPDRLAFVMTWHIPVITAGAVLVIVVGASLISMIRVIRLDPKSVFQG
ncbi:MAG: ABC transporter permease [Planctomycetes bacterium]|nr:ABC transporter permease [Planctomycetota bacterium]